MSGSPPSRYRLFEVAGLELEYPIVDGALAVRCLVEDAFREIRGRPTSEIEHGQVGFSNELAAHVFEMKNLAPRASLANAEADLYAALRYFADLLRERFGARLLPTGMHPLMHPGEARLWRRAGRDIYRAYASLFPLQGHGWLNVQSCHINLPFGSEEETVLLHNAIACLIPYLPALAASSPLYEGRLGACVDNRLDFYRSNQARIPEIAGAVVPEYMESFEGYRRQVLEPIYRALDRNGNGSRLRHEWVNSRGAILRFQRRAVEIRVLDMQECVRSDVAIATFVRGAARDLVRRLREGRVRLPPHELLVADFGAVIREGSAAAVRAPHLREGAATDEITARDVLVRMLETAADEVVGRERSYLPLVEERIRNGNLSERIRRRLARSERWSDARRLRTIRSIYNDLSECLLRNEPWDG